MLLISLLDGWSIHFLVIFGIILIGLAAYKWATSTTNKKSVYSSYSAHRRKSHLSYSVRHESVMYTKSAGDLFTTTHRPSTPLLKSSPAKISSRSPLAERTYF